MSRYTFHLPDIGEGIAEAEIVAWHVRLGEHVEEDAPLADVMTDKATVALESPVAGVVVELAGQVGERLAIRSPLVVLEVEGEGDAESTEPVRAEPGEAPSLYSSPPEKAKDSPSTRSRQPDSGVLTRQQSKVLASPAVRARAAALGIDLGTVPAGAGGRTGHGDLDAFLSRRLPVDKPGDRAVQKPVDILPGAGEQIKLIGLRRRIAEAMTASKRHIPHFSYVEECDVTAFEALRSELNQTCPDRPKLTVLPLLIRAICLALPDFPMINARFDDAAGMVTRYTSVHLGIAAQTPGGLMVPVVRDAQMLSLWQLAAEIARLSSAARDGSAKPGELTGSTLSVTSLGPLGGIATTPVINRPEVAIIGPNKIIERAVFVSDGAGGEKLEKRKLMNISISCDHRVVDGWDAANFVQAVKRLIEAPFGLLI
jgi:2-oxoisovalerate dehydrogenase E2 component (dihydrolipoyl transacylase)